MNVHHELRVPPEDAREFLMAVLGISKAEARELLRQATEAGRVELDWHGTLRIVPRRESRSSVGRLGMSGYIHVIPEDLA